LIFSEFAGSYKGFMAHTRPKIRVGLGYDVHRFAANRELWLGGVKIPHTEGLSGHSDADVLLHAVCDALLGAAGLRDIGHHFPDTDASFKGIDSKILLKRTFLLIQEKGFVPGNIDCTLIAEAPRVNPFVPEMKKVIAEILELDESEIGIKATTSEKMGFVGRSEGMAAHCVALIFGI
jgi:2-C-methyl-D-erythritol 2,4-cyclodiphosphate synthase